MFGELASGRGEAVADAWTYIDEVTHRTLNDYTSMVASVQYAAMKVRDPSSRGVLESVANRLLAQARAQHLLRPPRRRGIRRLDADLTELCRALSETLLAERSIELTLFCDPILLDARRSWQMCLIISELAMNAVRHAFADEEEGAITVDIRSNGRALRCLVSDTGSAAAAPAPGGGTTIVDGLVSDLGGQVSRIFSSSGSAVGVVFPLRQDTAADARVIL